MAATQRPRSGRPGFTLTELLVVLLIIAVLAALLSVTVTKLRASAHSANCVTNLRQMATWAESTPSHSSQGSPCSIKPTNRSSQCCFQHANPPA